MNAYLNERPPTPTYNFCTNRLLFIRFQIHEVNARRFVLVAADHPLVSAVCLRFVPPALLRFHLFVLEPPLALCLKLCQPLLPLCLGHTF